jgi:hypothetical protein
VKQLYKLTDGSYQAVDYSPRAGDAGAVVCRRALTREEARDWLRSNCPQEIPDDLLDLSGFAASLSREPAPQPRWCSIFGESYE